MMALLMEWDAGHPSTQVLHALSSSMLTCQSTGNDNELEPGNG